MSEAMKQRYGLIRRPWGVYYIKDKVTGAQTTLKTDDKAEAQRLLNAKNEAETQPALNLSLARVYLNGADPKLGTRTWQEVMEHIVAQKRRTKIGFTGRPKKYRSTGGISGSDRPCCRRAPNKKFHQNLHLTSNSEAEA
jgi:hypothetical protein